MRRRRIAPIGVALLLVATGACSDRGGDDDTGGTGAASTTTTATTAKASTTTTTTPPSTYTSVGYRVPFVVDLPAGWSAVERDDDVAQFFVRCSCPHGGEEHGEISLDLALADRSLEAAAEELASAPQLETPTVEPWSAGDLLGLHFIGRRKGGVQEVNFAASGYHSDPTGEPLEVIVFLARDRTVTAYVDPHEAKGADAERFRAEAGEVLAHLRFPPAP